MNDVTFFDKTYQPEKNLEYNLYVSVSAYNYSYCIFDTKKQTFIAAVHKNFEEKLPHFILLDTIKKAFQNDEILNSSYNQVFFVYQTSKSSLIPDKFFNSTTVRKQLAFSQQIDDVEEVRYNRLEKIRACNVFALPVALRMFLENHYKNIRFFQQATPFIDYYLFPVHWTENRLNGMSVKILVHRHFFDILVSDSKQLLLYNSFIYRNEKDFIYFVLFIFKKLQLVREKTEITLLGDISTQSVYYEELRKFIKNITFPSPRFHFAFDGMTNHIQNYFNNLLNIEP